MKAAEKVCLALDFPTRLEILSCARRFADRVGWLKVGLEAFAAEGPSIVREVAALKPRVFLDLKLHDIPATVERAVAAAARSGAAMINVHALGGRAMLEAARRGTGSSGGIKLIAVTLLTSLDARALSDLPVAGDPRGIARRLAILSRDCGLDGVVCSGEDLPAIRGACGPDFLESVRREVPPRIRNASRRPGRRSRPGPTCSSWAARSPPRPTRTRRSGNCSPK